MAVHAVEQELSPRFLLAPDPVRKQAMERNRERIVKALRPLYERGREHEPSDKFLRRLG
jgi:hypothetical protein